MLIFSNITYSVLDMFLMLLLFEYDLVCCIGMMISINMSVLCFDLCSRLVRKLFIFLCRRSILSCRFMLCLVNLHIRLSLAFFLGLFGLLLYFLLFFRICSVMLQSWQYSPALLSCRFISKLELKAFLCSFLS